MSAGVCVASVHWRGARRPGSSASLQIVNIGPPELILILLVVLLLFGGTKLPKLARSLGQAQREFKDGLREGSEDPRDDKD